MNDKRFVTGILLAMAIWFGGKIEAQKIILRGSSYRYAVLPASQDADYSYNWSVSGGTTSDFGFGAESELIHWNGPPGTYTITVFPTDPATGCSGNMKYLTVNVLDMSIRFQGVATEICSSTGNERRDFSVGVQFAENPDSWSFEYSIDDGLPKQVTVNGGNSMMISFAGFINPSTTETQIHVIRITKVISPGGEEFVFDGTEADSAGHIHKIIVHPTIPAGRIEFIRDL